MKCYNDVFSGQQIKTGRLGNINKLNKWRLRVFLCAL
jgi:hypothetical protein